VSGRRSWGGGGALVLTADLVARAIIAAALAYGDDPVRACTSLGKVQRRSLVAAAGGLARAEVCPVKRATSVLGVRPSGLYSARTKRLPAFLGAETAAMRAVEFAMWRPEAAESVVGGEAEDEAVLPPPEPEEAEAAPAAQVTGPVRQLLIVTRPAAIASPAAEPPRLTPASALRDRLVGLLTDKGPMSASSMATWLGVKELDVSRTLTALAHEGLVAAGEPGTLGRRWAPWNLVGEAAHGA
jgi:hypothetical protein